MIDKQTRDAIIALVHQEVVPAIGCTEPMCVALCTARATEKLGIELHTLKPRLACDVPTRVVACVVRPPDDDKVVLPVAVEVAY